MLIKTWFQAIMPALLVTGMIVRSSPARAQGEPVVVRLTPVGSCLFMGQSVDVVVEVVNTPPAYGYEFKLLFDPAFLEVVDADHGTFFDHGLLIPTINNTAGEVHFTFTQLNPSTEKSGSGSLAVIRFRGKADTTGAKLLDLSDVLLVQRDGTGLVVSIQDGWINVGLDDLQVVWLPLITQ